MKANPDVSFHPMFTKNLRLFNFFFYENREFLLNIHSLRGKWHMFYTPSNFSSRSEPPFIRNYLVENEEKKRLKKNVFKVSA